MFREVSHFDLSVDFPNKAITCKLTILFAAKKGSKSGKVVPLKEENAPVEVKYDLTYESAFYQHYFDTGVEKEKIFAPVYRYFSKLKRNKFDQI